MWLKISFLYSTQKIFEKKFQKNLENSEIVLILQRKLETMKDIIFECVVGNVFFQGPSGAQYDIQTLLQGALGIGTLKQLGETLHTEIQKRETGGLFGKRADPTLVLKRDAIVAVVEHLEYQKAQTKAEEKEASKKAYLADLAKDLLARKELEELAKLTPEELAKIAGE